MHIAKRRHSTAGCSSNCSVRRVKAGTLVFTVAGSCRELQSCRPTAGSFSPKDRSYLDDGSSAPIGDAVALLSPRTSHPTRHSLSAGIWKAFLPRVDLDTFRLQIGGHVGTPLSLSVADLRRQFEPVSLVALNQCSGATRAVFLNRESRAVSGEMARWAMRVGPECGCATCWIAPG